MRKCAIQGTSITEEYVIPSYVCNLVGMKLVLFCENMFPLNQNFRCQDISILYLDTKVSRIFICRFVPDLLLHRFYVRIRIYVYKSTCWGISAHDRDIWIRKCRNVPCRHRVRIADFFIGAFYWDTISVCYNNDTNNTHTSHNAIDTLICVQWCGRTH